MALGWWSQGGRDPYVCYVLTYLFFCNTENFGWFGERLEGNSLCLQCQDQLHDAV